ncbi:MAG: 4Fe-4S dicluster domain-containing protein [Clostridium sp.]|nr:4Fe-4S dicluster domain-containing protein [Clostridium sp.]MCM1460541.1 4Fe-4S dicluster domain-containing protein [Bacteroides sp.]
MRGIYTSVNDLRERVYAEVAKLSYDYKDGDLSQMEQIPYKIIPGEVTVYRDSVFLERAIVKERMRLSMGLPLRSPTEHAPVSTGAEECVKPEKYYQPPLINIIKFACHACPDNVVKITDACQGCLAHPCKEVCPRGAIKFYGGKTEIDQEKCIKCGKCVSVCPYGAIVKQERPCAKACGMNAISSDEYERAEINQDKCVSCGMCLANCPFGAIADKAQIFQVIQAIKSDVPVYAAIAPAVAGQFGPKLTPEKIRSAFQALGFTDVIEVAIGADLCTIQEAKDFVSEVPDNLPFMATSCCPAWSMMAKKEFPEIAHCISMAITPMVFTGRLLKKKYPDCKVAFIGPCAAKKLEASRRTIRSDIDFVLTFEEVMGMFEAKQVNFDELKEDDTMHGASGDGRGFAVSGGVANAVVNCISELYPECEVKVENAQGLAECRKLLAMAKAGKYDGYLLEGMACPGGCVAGAGTLQPIAKSTAAINLHKKVSTNAHALQSNYKDLVDELD